jgi:hypothetical protein
MFIVADDAPEIGSQLKVTLDDDGAKVTLNMEVVWRGSKTADNKFGVGVRIIGFDKGRDQYERFINRHLRPSTMPSQIPKASLRPASGAPPLASDPPKTSVRPDAAGRSGLPKP